jgi:hypothetical protein
MFAFANEVEPTKEVENLKKELTFLEDVYNCNSYDYNMAQIEDTPDQSNAEFMDNQAFWIASCNDAGGCPCEMSDPDILN